jgi:putative ABC transport system permease protein
MRFLFLIVRNTFRNRRRTILTILSIGMSIFLIATLKTLVDELENPPTTPDSAKRVIVRHATGLGDTLPIAHRERIRGVAGVEELIPSQWFGGVYKDPGNFFAQFAVDADKFFSVMSEVKPLSPEYKEAFIQNRTAALAGVKLAERFGWKIGERVTLEGTFIPANAETTVVGFVEGGGSENVFYFHWEYLNELSEALRDRVGTFVVKASSEEDLPAISESVDSMFANTASPTKTETEAAFILGFASMLGNVRLLVMSISTVVLFTVVLVAANTMAMSIRERTGEIAILRTLGFRPGQILGMMIAESMLIALTGALLGAVGGRYLYLGMDLNAITTGFIQTFTVRWDTVAIAMVIALLVAILSTFVPAFNASRIPISVAVRRRGE